MAIYVISFFVILLIVTGMSVGVIFANKPITGSCGGMAALGVNTDCDICGGDKEKCEKEVAKQNEDPAKREDLAYDATKTDK